jgi:hypothetical protein
VSEKLSTCTFGEGAPTRPVRAQMKKFTRIANVTIPADLAPGEYFLGAVIDEDDTLTEVTESNNATWVAIEVD